MADEIGVLNLTIKDNSDAAANGLKDLAGALRSVKSAASGSAEIGQFAETLRKISAAVEKGANSYRTLGRLATAMEKVKSASAGFKLPDFSKLESLAKSLQDNFNAENGLRRIAEGMEAIKSASEGFKMPSMKDLDKLSRFMNGGTGASVGGQGGQNPQEMAGMFADAKERVVELEQAIISLNGQFTSMFQTFQTGWTAGGGMDKFSQTFEAMNNMRMQHALPEGKGQEDTGFSSLKNEAIEVEGTVTEAYDTMSGRALTAGEAFTEAGSAMNAIIPYGKNLEDSWEHLNHIAQEAKQAWKDAHPGWGTGRIDPIVTGTNTFGADVRGENGKYLQDSAIDRIHRGTGLSEGEIRKQIDEIGERAKDAKARIQEMIDTLNQPVDPKLNWSQGIDRMMGIGATPKSAEDSASAFMNESYQQARELMDYLNQPLKINWSQAIDQIMGIGSAFKSAEDSAAAFTTGMAARIQELTDTLNQQIDYGNLSQGIDRMFGIGSDVKSAEDSYKAFLEGMEGESSAAQSLRELNPGMSDLQQQLQEAGYTASEFTSKMVDVDGELKAKKRDSEEASKGFLGLKETFTGLVQAFKTTVIGKLASQFARLAKRMALRAIIKQLSAAFKEGVENVYRYNEAIGGSFSADMDSAATSLLQMKNAIGAAVAPAIQMIIPYVQQLVSGFIEVINVVNQFMALMNGQAEWTRAVPYATKAFEDQKKSAKGVHDSMKDLLADWDELNIIQSNSGGGGSGSSGKAQEDYSKMFEQVKTFDSGIMEIAGIVKDVVGFALDHITEILAIVNLIKWGIKMTKFSSAFAGTVGTILALAGTALVMGLVFDVVTKLDSQFLKTGNVGYLIGDLLTTLLGGVIAKKVLTNVLGGSLANIAIPLALTVSAVASLVTLVGDTDTSALSPRALGLSAVDGLKVGAAAAYLTKTVLGKSLGTSLAGGAAVAVATFGVAVGIKTVVQSIKSGVTEETIKGAAMSSLAIGIGAGLFAKLAGATMLGSIAFGGAAAGIALMTIAAAIGIAAVLTTSKENITWGSYKATEEQIKNFVKEKGFEADVSATLTLVDNTIKLLPGEREAIESDASALIPTLQVIKYGIATEDTYNQLKEDLFGEDGEGGVIGRVKKYAKDQKTLIQTSFTLLPIVDKEGNIDKTATAEFMKEGVSGWNEVEKYMGEIGTQLAEALKGKTKEGIKTFDDELILELTNKLSNVQRAISQSQISSEGIGGMMTSLTGVTHDTFDQALSVWDDYKNQLKDKYAATLQEELTSYQSLAAFYAARGNEGDDKLAKYYQDKADELVSMWDDRLNYAMYEMTKPGREIFRKAILEMLNTEVTRDDITSALTESGFANYEMDDFIASMFDTSGRINETAGERFKDYLDDILSIAFGDDYKTIKALIDSGALSYADLIPKELISSMADGLAEEANNPELANAWKEFINKYFTENQPVVPDSKIEHTTEIQETIKETTEMETDGASASETPVSQAIQEVGNLAESTANAETEVRESNFELDTTGVISSTNAAASAFEDMARRIREAFSSLNGLSYEMDISGEKFSGAMNVLIPNIQQRAMGGPVKSGDLVMANENGNFEMMGRMGKQPVVANNQQIVNGISQGVATANGDVVSELRTLAGLMQKMLNKEFVAKAIPGADWGQHNSRSNDAWNRVNG